MAEKSQFYIRNVITYYGHYLPTTNATTLSFQYLKIFTKIMKSLHKRKYNRFF